MKQYLIILILLISALCGCQKSNEVIIHGKISGKIPDKITYSVPVSGVSYFGFNESVKPDSLGNFEIKIPTSEPAFILLTIPGIDLKVIVVEPGQNFNISVDTENKSGSFKISGPNEAGQIFYNTFPNPVMVQLEAKKYYKNPSQDSIRREINALKENEILRFREMLQKKEISKTFYDLVAIDRDCYYADLTTQVQYIKYIINLSGTDPKVHFEFPEEMKKVWEEAYIQYPPSEKDLIRSRWWFDYVQTYLICKEHMADDFKIQDLRDMGEKGMKQTHNIEIAKKYLSGRELEYYEAAYMYFECYAFQEFEKEFIKVFDLYKTDFPESKYTKYLEPMIQPIVEFYRIAEADFATGIRFVENYEKIETLKELVKSLKVKRVWVDIWATWCGSCKVEFKDKDKLTELLKSKGIEILYISIDEDNRDVAWKNMIKYYNLHGYHLRANGKLSAELRLLQNPKGGFYIPWHILLEQNGNIVKDPAEIAELEKVSFKSN